MKALYFTILILFSTVFAIGQRNSWNGIRPLHSTRTDVEKLLGKQREQGGYLLNGQFVSIQYSEKPYENKKNCECFVEQDTVLEIDVYLHKELKIKQLKLDLSRYRKTVGTHLLDRFTYSNFDEGIVYEVSKDDNRVLGITYLPSKNDCEELLKSNLNKKKSLINDPF